MLTEMNSRPEGRLRIVRDPDVDVGFCDEQSETSNVWLCNCGEEVVVQYTVSNHLYTVKHGHRDVKLFPFVEVAQRLKLGSSPIVEWVLELHENDQCLTRDNIVSFPSQRN